MSTTDHQSPMSGGFPVVRELDAVRARRRLEHLPDLRARLAALAAERLSHGLDDAMDIYGQQLAVEHAIDQEYPEIHAERFPRWVEQDLALFSMQRHTSFHQSTPRPPTPPPGNRPAQPARSATADGAARHWTVGSGAR